MLTFALCVALLALTCGFIVAASLLGARWITQLIDHSVQRQSAVMVESLGSITTMVKDAVISTVGSTTQGVLASLVGEPNTPVVQHTVPADEDLTNPEWTKWDDGDPDAEFSDIGDSVFFRRPDSDSSRVAGIEEGEAIIPGVPVPDMTGEGWQPG